MWHAVTLSDLVDETRLSSGTSSQLLASYSVLLTLHLLKTETGFYKRLGLEIIRYTVLYDVVR